MLSALVTITLLPVALASAGRRLDWPRRRLRTHVGASRAWTTWARAVVRGRWGATVAAVAALAILGGFTLRLQVGDEQASSLASAGPAHQGLVALRAAGVPAGVLTPIEVLVPASAATDPAALASGLARVPGVWAAVAPNEPAWRRAGTALVEVAAVAEPAASRPSNGSVPPCSAWHRARGSGASALRTSTLPARSTVASR